MDKAIMDVRIKSWMPIFEEQAKSGLTKKAFCEKHGIKRHDFFYWQRQIRNYLLEQNEECSAKTDLKESSIESSSFFEITPVSDNLSVPEVIDTSKESQIKMPSSLNISYGGFSVEMNGELNEAALAAIFKVMKHAD